MKLHKWYLQENHSTHTRGPNTKCQFSPTSQDYRTLGLCPLSGILKNIKNTTFQKLDLFPFSGEGWETPSLLGPFKRAHFNHWTTYVSITSVVHRLRLALSNRPSGVGVFHPSPQDRNRFSFRNLFFCVLLEYQMMGKVQKSCNPECYTPSSEPFGIYLF
jgi:hypothetical protein